MMKKKPCIHFFDVDHTITKKSTGLRYLIQGLRLKMLPWSMFIYFPVNYIGYKIGRLNEKRLRTELPFIKGKTRKELELIAEKAFNKNIKNDIYTDAVKLINQLKKQGNKVVIASSSVDIVLKPLLQYLDVQDTICSTVAFNNNICLGRFDPIPVFKNEKLKKVSEFVNTRSESLKDCYFYSDSIHDLPLLQKVGHPIAVNPDKKLKRIAKRSNWKIMYFNE